jgi:hypothetical protein
MDDKSNNAAAALTEAIDDFLGDLERKFKGISGDILTKRKKIPSKHVCKDGQKKAGQTGG